MYHKGVLQCFTVLLVGLSLLLASGPAAAAEPVPTPTTPADGGEEQPFNAPVVPAPPPIVHEEGPRRDAAAAVQALFGQVARLEAGDGEALDYFGFAVALDGDVAAAGAYRDDDACPADPNCDSGAVYLFARDQGGPDGWGQVIKLTAGDAGQSAQFGWSVALDGDRLVVGSPGDDEGGAYAGAAYLFERNAGGADNWGQVNQADRWRSRRGGPVRLFGGDRRRQCCGGRALRRRRLPGRPQLQLGLGLSLFPRRGQLGRGDQADGERRGPGRLVRLCRRPRRRERQR